MSTAATGGARGPSEPAPLSRIVRRAFPGVARFKAERLRSHTPGVFIDEVTRWPAFGRWSLDWFGTRFGDELVPVEFTRMSASGASIVFTSRLTRLADYVDEIRDGGTPQHGYLAQLNVRKYMSGLLDDLDFPRMSGWQYTQTNLWIGPTGKSSKLHFDYLDNFLVQMVGRKRVQLYAPGGEPSKYLTMRFPFCHFSMIEEPGAWRMDGEEALRLHEIRPDFDVTLHAGEMLFIPALWWHRVTSLDPSISVNQFYAPLLALPGKVGDLLARGVRERLRWASADPPAPARSRRS